VNTDFLNASGFFNQVHFHLGINIATPNSRPWLKKEENVYVKSMCLSCSICMSCGSWILSLLIYVLDDDNGRSRKKACFFESGVWSEYGVDLT
jgi:hypothetical protein